MILSNHCGFGSYRGSCTLALAQKCELFWAIQEVDMAELGDAVCVTS